jgi:uncharacterized protein YndB with AHSA1/START domain
MSRTVKLFHCSPEDVFRVLADGWSFATWVVGAARIRDVDPTWPDEGAEIHHSVGAWPVLLDDTTTVLTIDRPHSLTLQARAWPTGEAEVTLLCESDGPSATRVTMLEHPTSGPARLLPRILVDPILGARNTEALRRLAFLTQRGGDESRRSSHD